MMSLENSGGEMSPPKISPIEIREKRVYSYMGQFNKAPIDSIKSEIEQLITKNGLSEIQGKLTDEIKKSSSSDLKLVNEQTIVQYGEKLNEKLTAEDAVVALLYDLQNPLKGRNMHIIPPELPKLLQILDDTRHRKQSLYMNDSVMTTSKDQAVLFLTQVFFYDKQRIEGKRVIYTDGKTPDEIEIQKLAQKFNVYLPEKDKFLFIEHQRPVPKLPPILLPKKEETKEEIKKDDTERRKSSPIQTSAEKKRAKELEDVLMRTSKNATIAFDASGGHIEYSPVPYPPFFATALKEAVGETFGAQGKENIAYISLLYRILPGSKKQLVNWLFTEKGIKKQRMMIDKLVTSGGQLLNEVLLVETNKKYSDAFAQDVLHEDLNIKELHTMIVANANRLMGEDKGMQVVKELAVDMTERLFLLQRATILGKEIREEIQMRRKAMKIIPIDSEGTSSLQDIQLLLKKIEDQVEVEFPLDPKTPIRPYEFNVHFSYTSQEVNSAITQLICGENNANFDLLQMSKKDMQEAIYSLGIEKWSHQARHHKKIRQMFSSEDREKAGHIMPYSIETVTNEEGTEDRIQTYHTHHHTADQANPQKRRLFVISDTGLSIPVMFIPPKKRGQDMCIEYVNGLSGRIKGKEVMR